VIAGIGSFTLCLICLSFLMIMAKR
jgi:hypothetical protein